MRRHYQFAAALALSAGLATFGTGLWAQQTWTVDATDPTADFTTLHGAIADAGVVSGDTIEIGPGTYLWPSRLTLSKSLTITGSGPDQTTIGGGFDATGNSTETFRINAANVTIEDVRIEPFTDYPGKGRGYGISVQGGGDNLTLRNVHLHADGIRSFIIGGTQVGSFTMENSLVTGECSNEAFRNRAIDYQYHGNVFDFEHYGGGGGVFVFAGSTPITGEIKHNYFLIGHDGDWPTPRFSDEKFSPSGTSNLITLWANPVGLTIENNTFVYTDHTIESAAETFPTFNAIRLNPSQPVPVGGLVVKYNIFDGFDYADDAPEPSGSLPVWSSDGPLTGLGSIEYNGVTSAAYFESEDFDIGAVGTMNFWARLNTIGKRHQFWEGPGNGAAEVQFRNNGGGQWYGSPNGSLGQYSIQTGGHTSVGVWTNIQVTWDLGAGEMRVYHNGTEHGYLSGFGPANLSNWTASTVVDTTLGRHFIGVDPGTSDRVVDGRISDIAFFDEVLSASDRDDIRADGVGAHAGSLSSLVAHWSFASDFGSATSIPTDNGLDIDLELSNYEAATNALFEPGALVLPSNTEVEFNLFHQNAQPANIAVSGTNLVDVDPLFVGTGATAEEIYALQTGSPAVGVAGGNIGASQDSPPSPPTVVAQQDLVVPIDGYRIINPRFLSADNEPGAGTITYNVTSGPDRGTLSATSFTQEEIDDREVWYRHDGSDDVFEDSFTFTMTDSIGTSSPVEFDIIVLDMSQLDTDLDGLPDYFEVLIGTDPEDRDTSGDGFEDGLLVALGLDPLADNSALTNVFGVPQEDLPPTSDDPRKAYTDDTYIAAFYQIALGHDPTDPNDWPQLGDVTDSNDLTIQDALQIFRAFLGLIPMEDLENNGNVNRDRNPTTQEEIVDNVDAVLIINVLLENIDSLPTR